MTWPLTVLVLSLLLLPLVVSIRRSTELFRVRVRDGKAQFTRGRMPQRLLDDWSDIVRSPPIARAEIWAVRRGGKPRLETKGEISQEQCQRLRNTLGMYSLARLLAAGGRAARTRR